MNRVKYRRVGRSDGKVAVVSVLQKGRHSSWYRNWPKRRYINATDRAMMRNGFIRARKHRLANPEHDPIAQTIAQRAEHRRRRPWRVNQRTQKPNRFERRHRERARGVA